MTQLKFRQTIIKKIYRRVIPIFTVTSETVNIRRPDIDFKGDCSTCYRNVYSCNTGLLNISMG
jgi:hypothetical protein